jgi:glutathionyl-hydroquinone reductase
MACISVGLLRLNPPMPKRLHYLRLWIKLETRLGKQRYLVGDRLTEADWRLFTTLVRFDPVYVGHFKCNKQRIADYPNLSNYLHELYQYQRCGRNGQPGSHQTALLCQP